MQRKCKLGYRRADVHTSQPDIRCGGSQASSKGTHAAWVQRALSYVCWSLMNCRRRSKCIAMLRLPIWILPGEGGSGSRLRWLGPRLVPMPSICDKICCRCWSSSSIAMANPGCVGDTRPVSRPRCITCAAVVEVAASRETSSRICRKIRLLSSNSSLILRSISGACDDRGPCNEPWGEFLGLPSGCEWERNESVPYDMREERERPGDTDSRPLFVNSHRSEPPSSSSWVSKRPDGCVCTHGDGTWVRGSVLSPTLIGCDRRGVLMFTLPRCRLLQPSPQHHHRMRPMRARNFGVRDTTQQPRLRHAQMSVPLKSVHCQGSAMATAAPCAGLF